LRKAREQRGFSAQDVAELLYLTPSYITAIEQGDIDQLPGRAFAQGYVRAYARLLDLNAEQMLEAFDAEQGKDTSVRKKDDLKIPGDVRPDMEAGHPLVRWFSWFVAVVLVLGTLYWIVERTGDPAEPSVAPVVDESATVELSVEEGGARSVSNSVEVDKTELAISIPPTAGESSTTSVEQAKKQLNAVELMQADSAESGTTAGTAAVVVDDSKGTLSMSFSADSWVSITDGNGDTLIASVKRAGDSAQLEGELPFSITLGKASAVVIQFNGKPVDLDPYVQVNTARLVLGE